MQMAMGNRNSLSIMTVQFCFEGADEEKGLGVPSSKTKTNSRDYLKLNFSLRKIFSITPQEINCFEIDGPITENY